MEACRSRSLPFYVPGPITKNDNTMNILIQSCGAKRERQFRFWPSPVLRMPFFDQRLSVRCKFSFFSNGENCKTSSSLHFVCVVFCRAWGESTAGAKNTHVRPHRHRSATNTVALLPNAAISYPLRAQRPQPIFFLPKNVFWLTEKNFLLQRPVLNMKNCVFFFNCCFQKHAHCVRSTYLYAENPQVLSRSYRPPWRTSSATNDYSSFSAK